MRRGCLVRLRGYCRLSRLSAILSFKQLDPTGRRIRPSPGWRWGEMAFAFDRATQRGRGPAVTGLRRMGPAGMQPYALRMLRATPEGRTSTWGWILSRVVRNRAGRAA